MLLVVAPRWDAQDGSAQRYERGPRSPWRKIGPAFPVMLGRGGLGWRSDPGAPEPLTTGPRKQEGDGRSPAGIMALGQMWGYDKSPPKGVKLTYHAATDADRCVDDITAPQYGRLLVEPKGGAPWNSAERMRRGDEMYKLLIVVDYNMAHPLPGAGSCIFLHLQGAPDVPTVGCTAMSEADMLTLSRWLDPGKHPVLVQLPAAVLPAAHKEWKLP